MGDMFVLQGRVATATYEAAIEAIRAKLTEKGYEARKIAPYPCPVQPWKGVVWWEWQCICTEK